MCGTRGSVCAEMRIRTSLRFKDKFLDVLHNSLPLEILKDLPDSITFVIVLFIYLCILAGFITSYISSYRTLRDEVFLSLSDSAGSCSKVSKVINGVYLADTNGNWEGNIDFQYRQAIYVMTLSNFNGEELKFTALLNDAFETLELLGKLSYSLNLADNLIIWMAVTMYAQTDQQVHTFQLYGDPKIVFNPTSIFASMSNEQGNCDVPPTVTYDRSVGIYTISYPITRYVSSASCLQIANPLHFGYTGLGSDFTIRIDMQSAITALGVNIGLIPMDQLEKVAYTESYFTSDGIDYIANFYYYPRYPGMTPLFCVTLATTGQLVCALEYGSIYAYPLFNHIGASLEKPTYCDCENGIGLLQNCSQFYLLSGLLFYEYSGSDLSSSYNDLMRLITSSTNGEELNRNAYNISADSILSYSSVGSEWRHDAYEFCTKNSSQGCSVLSIAAGSQTLHTVSPYYYQVRDLLFLSSLSLPPPHLSLSLALSLSCSLPKVPFGSCNNSFTISKESQAKLLENPPTQLTEVYYECSRSQEDSLLTALGLSVGNTVLIRYLLILTFSVLLFAYNRSCWLRCCRSNHQTTYSAKEREKVLHFFAFNLLLSRDGFFTQQESSENEGGTQQDPRRDTNLIQRIQHELSLQTDIKRFYSSADESPSGEAGEVTMEIPKEKNARLLPEKASPDLEKALLGGRKTLDLEGLNPQRHSSSSPSPSLGLSSDDHLPSSTMNPSSSVEILWNPLRPVSPPPPSE
jgi:hypothetical protein